MCEREGESEGVSERASENAMATTTITDENSQVQCVDDSLHTHTHAARLDKNHMSARRTVRSHANYLTFWFSMSATAAAAHRPLPHTRTHTHSLIQSFSGSKHTSLASEYCMCANRVGYVCLESPYSRSEEHIRTVNTISTCA